MALEHQNGEPGKVCSKCKEWRPVERFRPRVLSRDGYNSMCRECDNENSRRWRANNKERVAELNREFYQANRKQRLEYHRQYRQEHKDYFREKILEFRRENETYHRDYVRAWSRRNPDKIKAHDNARRAAKRAGGRFTAAEWVALKQRYDYHCLRCGRREPEISLSADHVIPLSKSGLNIIDNIQPLCKPCNTAKHTDDTDYRPLWQGIDEPNA
jgi:5-methylcytosine-specific restriction endonuclease McrA